MSRTRGGWALLAAVVLGATGCRTCDRYSNRTADKDDRFCATAGKSGEGRLAALPGCDPVATGYGQPGAVFADGSVVGSLPGMGTPFPGRPENELPFPQTIPSPGVPAAPPVAGFGRGAYEVRLPK